MKYPLTALPGKSHKTKHGPVQRPKVADAYLKPATSIKKHNHVRTDSLDLEDPWQTNAIITGMTGFIFTNSYLTLYQFFTKRMTMEHHQFKRNLANSMALFKAYNIFFNIRNILTQTCYALIYSLFPHICSHDVILYHKFYFIV